MIWKILTFAGIVIAIWTMVRRAMHAAAPPAAARNGPSAPVEDLVRCRACGAWKPAAEACACQVPPTP